MCPLTVRMVGEENSKELPGSMSHKKTLLGCTTPIFKQFGNCASLKVNEMRFVQHC